MARRPPLSLSRLCGSVSRASSQIDFSDVPMGERGGREFTGRLLILEAVGSREYLADISLDTSRHADPRRFARALSSAPRGRGISEIDLGLSRFIVGVTAGREPLLARLLSRRGGSERHPRWRYLRARARVRQNRTEGSRRYRSLERRDTHEMLSRISVAARRARVTRSAHVKRRR